jgi:hypothetical protein
MGSSRKSAVTEQVSRGLTFTLLILQHMYTEISGKPSLRCYNPKFHTRTLFNHILRPHRHNLLLK